MNKPGPRNTPDHIRKADDYLRAASEMVQQIARMSLTDEAYGDLGNDEAMDGLIRRARELLA